MKSNVKRGPEPFTFSFPKFGKISIFVHIETSHTVVERGPATYSTLSLQSYASALTSPSVALLRPSIPFVIILRTSVSLDPLPSAF